MELATLTSVLGWMTVLNLGYLIVATIGLTIGRSWVIGIHSRLTGVADEDLEGHYFSFLANYKIGVLILNLVPYVSLKIVG